MAEIYEVMQKKTQGGYWLFLLAFLIPYVATLLWQGDLGLDPAYQANQPMIRCKDGSVLTVEEYLPGMTAAQLPVKLFEYSHCTEELLQLQTLIARTYLYRHLNAADSLIINEEDLAYRGWTQQEVKEYWGTVWYEEYYPQLIVAAYKTENKVICYENQLIYPMYHFASPGHTRNHNSLDYLKCKECPYDYLAPEATEVFYIGKEEVPVLYLWEVDQDGYCEEIVVGEQHMTVENFIADIAELSTAYLEIEELEDSYRVLARGDGHGYGVSQWSANAMALEGKTLQQIISYFYTGCEIKILK